MSIPVLFMIQHLDHGGTEHHFHDVVTGLDRSRFTPHVIHCTGGVVSRQLEAVEGLAIQRVDLKRAYDLSAWRAVRQVRRAIRENAIAAVVTYHFVADFIGCLAAGPNGPPVISNRRDMGFTRTARQIAIGRRLSRRIARYVAVSEAVRQAVARDERVDPGRIDVIHNGIDLERIHRSQWDLAAERSRLGIAPDELVIGCIAAFNPVKDHLTLIDAFAQFRRNLPDLPAKLLLVGDGEMRGPIEARIAQRDIQNDVLMPGRSDAVEREVQLCDIIVLPSRSEGFSNAILQAMAFAKPVIATRAGGNPEAVVEGETGYLTESGNASELAETLARVAQDSGLRDRLGQAGRDRIEQSFTKQTMLRSLEDQIAKALDHTGVPSAPVR